MRTLITDNHDIVEVVSTTTGLLGGASDGEHNDPSVPGDDNFDDDLQSDNDAEGSDGVDGAASTDSSVDEAKQATKHDETVVHVQENLLAKLKEEVDSYLSTLASQRPRAQDKVYRCLLCPFRGFKWKSRRLRLHVLTYHNEKTNFCASGNKQLRIACAIFDDDCYLGRCKGEYLARSAELLRSTVTPGLSNAVNSIDRHIRLVFTGKGPEYQSLKQLCGKGLCRRVMNLYYTHDFAELLRREAMLYHSNVRSLIPRLQSRAMESGNLLGSLYYGHQHWWSAIEDIFQSKAMTDLKVSFETSFLEHEEYEYLSLDATFKVCLKIKGQASYRASKAERDAAAFDDDEALRRVLTCRGRTGAVIDMAPVKTEKSTEIKDCLEARLPSQSFAQVRFIASDSPSYQLWIDLCEIFPNLLVMCLDPIHICS